MNTSAGRAIVATFWAAALVLIGIAALDCQLMAWRLDASGVRNWTPQDTLIGLAAVCGIAVGQLLFLTVVADRLCPMAHWEVRWLLKTLALVVFCGGVIGIGYECWRLI